MAEQRSGDTPEDTGNEPAKHLPNNWFPTWETPFILKGGEVLIQGGAKVYDWVKSKGPLHLQVDDSRPDEDDYVILLTAINLAANSLYIESIACIEPFKEDLVIGPPDKSIGRVTDNADSKPSPVQQPVLLKTTSARELRMKLSAAFADKLRTRIKNHAKPAIQVQLVYSMLNEDGPRKADPLTIRIRL